MIRKIVKHGLTTLTISLPSKWVKKNNINSGDELDVIEKNKSLMLNIFTQKNLKKDEVDTKSYNKIGKRQISTHYRKGYDEITLHFNDPAFLVDAEEILSDEIVGFEIVKQSPKTIVIRDIVGTKDDFSIVLRRVTFLILNMIEDTYSGISNKEVSKLKGVIVSDKRVNKFTNFCIRTLNKVGHEKSSNIPTYYHLLRDIEQLADSYKEICRHIIDNDIKSSKIIQNHIKDINKSVRMFFDLFFKMNDKDLNELYNAINKKNNELIKLIKTQKDDALILHYLCMINNYIKHLWSCIIELRID
jgi:phosphate uptake regulator